MECGCFFLVARRRVWCWRVRLSGLPSYSEASSAAAWAAEPGPSSRQPTEAFRRNSFPWFCSRCSHLISLRPRTWQSRVRCLEVQRIGFFGAQCLARLWIHVLSGCCLRNTVFDSSGDSPVTRRNAWLELWIHFCISTWRFWTNCTHFYVDVGSDLRCSVSVLAQNGEVCSADASAFSPGMRVQHLENWTLLLRASRG